MANVDSRLLKQLWTKIHQEHTHYLISLEAGDKNDQRKKLEDCMKDYLHLAPHYRKFTYTQTAQVLHNSASNKENFNCYKAANAWKAIGRYADNLFCQPWRKEFTDLKLYCGFYKHEVEENLADAELMFEAMGYCHVGNSTMIIADVLDVDKIASVSKDAILAYVECEIMIRTLELSDNVSWLEILECRENYIGTPEETARILKYNRRERQHREQMRLREQYEAIANYHRQSYSCGPSMNYCNYLNYPSHSYTHLNHSRYMFSQPQCISPSSMYPPPPHPAYIPQNTYWPNGYPIQPHCPPQNLFPNYYTVPPEQSSVPTGQLIELDSTIPQSSDRFQRYPENEIASNCSDFDENDFPSGKTKEDGPIYRDYSNKNSDIQNHKMNYSRAEKGIGSESKSQVEIVENFRKMNITKEEAEDDAKSKGRSHSETAAAAAESKRPEQGVERVGNRPTNPEKEEIENETKRTSTALPIAEEDDDDGEKWECISCTYLNSRNAVICEMCCKSKERRDEGRPQPSGGQECRICTLVNEKGRNFCFACNEPLKDSPTYI